MNAGQSGPTRRRERRNPRRWLIPLLLFALLGTVLIAAQLGLASSRPSSIDVQIRPLTTADYSQWASARFNRLDPVLGTLIVQENIATAAAQGTDRKSVV